MIEDAKPASFKKTCIILYGIYALSAVLQFFDATMLLGVLTLTIACIIASSKKTAAKDTLYASHLRWLNRTLWIGSLVVVPVAIIITAILVSIFTDVGTLSVALGSGDSDSIMAGVQGYIARNMTKISIISTITTTLPVIWWVRRCWTGYVLVKEDRSVENVMSWL